MRFMIYDRDAYHDIPTPDHNPYDDKYVTIMHKYGLTTGVWYPCELMSTLPCPDMSDVWAFDIQLSNMPKHIRVLKSEIDNGYVKLDFDDSEATEGEVKTVLLSRIRETIDMLRKDNTVKPDKILLPHPIPPLKESDLDWDQDAIDHPAFPPLKATSSACEAMFMEAD